jgi:biopolymer transport protein ExbB
MRNIAFVTIMSVIAIATSADVAIAQAGEDGTQALNYSLIDLIQFGGWVGYIIILLSVGAVALVVEYSLSIRQKTLAPDEEIDSLTALVASGAYDQVSGKLDDESCSFLTTVVARGVREHDRGYDVVVKHMEDASDEQTGRLLRKIEHLNLIANISPMLGLLGTVMGMVASFNQISVSVGGVDPRRLAGGIFEALMTTVMGLIVAIPSLYAYGIFRNRVDSVVADTGAKAEDIVAPLKNGARVKS